MRYALLLFITLHTSAAMACEAQSNVESGDSSTTVTKQDCTDQVVPQVTPQQALPVIPSVGVKTEPAPAPPSAAAPDAPALQPVDMPPPKAAAVAPAKPNKPKARHNYRAVVKRLHKPRQPKAENKPMFWWHTRQ